MLPITRRRATAGLATILSAPLWAAPSAARAETLTVTFAHVNDIYQHEPVDGRGGLAELDTLLTAARAQARGPFFVTFGGDLISPSLTSSVTQGAHMITLLNALGVDVAVLGNHEFDFGSAVARQRIAESRFPWLGANVLAADGRPFSGAGTVLLERDGMKVGFVGVLTRRTGELAVGVTDVTFGAEEAALRAGAEALRAQGAELVVALTHQDLADDMRMARTVKGIDLILGGHDHDPYALQETGAPVMKAGSDAQWLGVVELRFTRPDAGAPGRSRVAAVGWRLVPNVDVAPSPRLAPLVAGVAAQLEGILSQPLATLAAPLDSRTAVVRRQESALGDVVADALRAHFGADAALINGGGLRGNRVYPVGHVLTRRDLLAEMPFNNAVTLLEVNGAVLLAALEHGLSGIEKGAGRFPQVSGMKVTYDPAATRVSRVKAVEIGGKALDVTRTYRLATSDYLAGGGDGYAMLETAKVLVDASGGPLLVNVAAEALLRAGTLAVAQDGRLAAVERP